MNNLILTFFPCNFFVDFFVVLEMLCNFATHNPGSAYYTPSIIILILQILKGIIFFAMHICSKYYAEVACISMWQGRLTFTPPHFGMC